MGVSAGTPSSRSATLPWRHARPHASDGVSAMNHGRLPGVLSLVLLGAGLVACSAGAPAAESQPASERRSEPATPAPEQASDETPIRIVLGDQVLEARLWDNPAAQSLIDQLPLTLDFSDYGGQEVLARPPQPLTMEGMPAGESAPAGTIGYYAPGQAIVLYYADVGQYPGIVRIGWIDGDASVLAGWSEPRSATIERSGGES